MDEFELIRRFFDRQADTDSVAVGIGDDGAVLRPDTQCDQVQVMDTLVAGVHFPHTTDAFDIAYRSVAVNLSDVAAMGGCAKWMTLALTLSDATESWLTSFAEGLFAAADAYGLVLVGGDTTSGPNLVVTVSITAEVPRGAALLRDGARAGDAIFVTGTMGDAAAGLALLQRGASDDFLVGRFLRPSPRLNTGRKLRGKATAAIDISDGLAGDLQKLLSASGVGGDVDVDRVPLSNALRTAFPADEQIGYALVGGDDYELCFTAPTDSVADISGITNIGTVTDSTRLKFFSGGHVVDVCSDGYRHFQ